MDPLVSLLCPPVRLRVEVSDVRKVMSFDKSPDISDRPFHAPFLIPLARIARMDGDAHVRHVVDELGVEGERLSRNNHALEVIVPIVPGRAADLLVGSHMAVQEELHGRAVIERHEEVSGPREDEDEGVNLTER